MITTKTKCYHDIEYQIDILREMNTYLFYCYTEKFSPSLEGFSNYILSSFQYSKRYLEDVCNENITTFANTEKCNEAIAEQTTLLKKIQENK